MTDAQSKAPVEGRIREIRERYEATTPGRWRSMRDGNQYVDVRDGGHTLVGASRIDGLQRAWNPYSIQDQGEPFMQERVRLKDADADFIAYAHDDDIPWLLTELTASRSRERALTEERDGLRKQVYDLTGIVSDKNDKIAGLTSENKRLKDALGKIARDLPQRGPSGFEDFSTAYSRIKHMARTAFLTTTNDGGGK